VGASPVQPILLGILDEMLEFFVFSLVCALIKILLVQAVEAIAIEALASCVVNKFTNKGCTFILYTVLLDIS
jgi:hypothetical protein